MIGAGVLLESLQHLEPLEAPKLCMHITVHRGSRVVCGIVVNISAALRW